jgi:signal transduction histidine kinase
VGGKLVFENLMIWPDEVFIAGSARFPGNNKIFQPFVSSFDLLSNHEIGFLMRETAEFWIELDDSILHIRYFAVRNAKGFFHGILEVSRDVTEIRKLEGQRRLLGWEY